MTNNYISPLRVSPVEGEKIGQYTISSILGEGTFGTVYKVKDAQNKVFALKLLRLFELYPVQERQNVAKRFALEFDTAKINSPQLVTSYEKGEEKGNPYFTMRYCSKGSLRNKVGTNVDENFIKRIAIDVLFGLKALHENGKIHRDLKPDNILLDEDNNARLTDFGIAGHLNLEKKQFNEREIRLTTTNILGKPKERFGSYPYMPPEQIKPPNRIVTKIPANDFFSFGATIFEILTGHLPYGTITSDAELADYILKVNNGKWLPIRKFRTDISDVWQEIITGCLEPDYRKRFSKATDILSLLGHASIAYKPFSISNKFELKIMQGEEFNKCYNLNDLLFYRPAGLLTIGRRDIGILNQIEIQDENQCYVSRYHATIEKQSENWFIRDGQWKNINGKGSWIKSANGTFVNGIEINEKGIKLNINDIITLGDTTLKVISE